MSSGILRKYAPDNVAVNLGTQTAIGFQSGTFIEAERTAETGSLDAGTDGEVTLVINPNKTGTIKLTLQQASPTNDYLNTVFQALQNKDTVNGVIAVSIIDKNGTTQVNSKQSVIQKPAKVTFADKTEGREWTILCPYLDLQPGSEASV